MSFAALIGQVSFDRVMPAALQSKARDLAIGLVGLAFVLSAVISIHFDEQIAPALDRLSERVISITQTTLAAARDTLRPSA
ncbi:MAG: hypothetical protein ABW199_07045 [Caulobacterales bacterium]